MNIYNDVQSGTRIKARWMSTADGARQFLGWRDTGRNTDCSFWVSGDGVVRCLPIPMLYGGSYFADSACTQPVALDYGGPCPSSNLINAPDYSGCPARSRVFNRGSQVTNPDGGAPAAYYKSGGSCYSTQTGSAKVYRYGTEVPPSSFIGTTRAVSDLVGSYQRATLTGDDGCKAFGGPEDKTGGFGCYLGVAKDLTHRCLPAGSAYMSSNSYANSACTQPLVQENQSACPTPRFATLYDSATCPASMSVFGVGAPVGTPFLKSGSSCMAGTASPAWRYYAAGSESNPSSFLSASPVDGPAFGRLVAKELELGPNVRATRNWFDTQLGSNCFFATAADGQWRCLPSDDAYVQYYSDSTCTTRVAASYDGCTPKYARSYDSNFCPQRMALYPVISRYTGASYYKSGSSCSPLTPGGQSAFWTIGSELPATTFVPGTESVQ